MITTFLMVTSSMPTCSSNWLSIFSNLSLHKQNTVSILPYNTNGAGEKNLKFYLPYAHVISCSLRFTKLQVYIDLSLELFYRSPNMLTGHHIKSFIEVFKATTQSFTFQTRTIEGEGERGRDRDRESCSLRCQTQFYN